MRHLQLKENNICHGLGLFSYSNTAMGRDIFWNQRWTVIIFICTDLIATKCHASTMLTYLPLHQIVCFCNIAITIFQTALEGSICHGFEVFQSYCIFSPGRVESGWISVLSGEVKSCLMRLFFDGKWKIMTLTYPCPQFICLTKS